MPTVDRIDQGGPDFDLRTWAIRRNRLTYNYQYLTASFTFGTVALSPAQGTIRGGEELLVTSSALLLDTSFDKSLLGALPAGLASVTAGSGSIAPKVGGVEFDSGVTAVSTAGLETDDDFDRFDVCVDVLPIHPSSSLVSGSVDLGVLEARTVSGAIARVRLVRGAGADPSIMVGLGEIVSVSGPPVVGGIVRVADPLSVVTLRIVRRGARVFGFVGSRATDVFEKVLDFSTFATDAGPIRFYVGNRTLATRVRSRFTDLTFRSHMLIGDQLLLDKVDISARRMTGVVPSVSLSGRGLVDVVIFGLFGEVVLSDGFEYILPDTKVVGRTSASILETAEDEAMDG